VVSARGGALADAVADHRRGDADLPIVAILADGGSTDYLNALVAGATAVAARDSSGEALVQAIDLACEGNSIIPVDLLHNLLRGEHLPGPPQLSEEDRYLLSALSSGQTVRSIAGRLAYSERATYRKLQKLYERIGVRNRAEAIAISGKWSLESHRM
jgi:DNA-binding NarL/FixJ family response regulator